MFLLRLGLGRWSWWQFCNVFFFGGICGGVLGIMVYREFGLWLVFDWVFWSLVCMVLSRVIVMQVYVQEDFRVFFGDFEFECIQVLLVCFCFGLNFWLSLVFVGCGFFGGCGLGLMFLVLFFCSFSFLCGLCVCEEDIFRFWGFCIFFCFLLFLFVGVGFC